MKRSTYILFQIAAILMLNASAGRAQIKTGRADTWGFVNARYDTRSSASMYTGYGWRAGFAMAGVLRNARSGQAEMLGGVGAAFRTGPNAEHWLALATTQTGRVAFAQVFWLPTVRAGAVTTRAQVKWSVAHRGSAPQKLSVSPLSMTLPIRCRMSGGVAVEMAAAEGARTSIGTGPELRLTLPRAALVADALHDVPGSGSRLRLFFASRF